jgi:polysaccharide biosynthesis transport protein
MLDRPYPAPMGGAVPQTVGGPPAHGYSPYAGYGFEEQEREGLFDPLKLLFLAVQYRWLIAAMVAMAVVTGLVVTMMQTPVYQSTSRLEVMVPSARVFQDMEVVSESGDVRAFLTARERLKSRSLVERVVFQLGLAEKPEFLYPAPDFSPLNILARAFGWRDNPTLDRDTPEDRERIAVNRVLNNLSVELITNTSLLAISYRDQNPDFARDIANQVAQSFIDQKVDQTGETSDLARQFIQEQVLQVKERLEASEQALLNYARDAGITVTGNEISLIADNINALNTALSTAIEDRLNYDLLVRQIDLGRGGSLEQVLSSEGLQKLRSDIAELRAEYQQKLTTFKPEFPEMRQLQTRIAELERQYQDGVAIVVDNVRLKREEAATREADIRAKLADLEAEQIAYEDKNIQYTILKREVDSSRLQYESLITKLNEVGVGSELRNQNVSIADFAVRAGGPVSPRLSVNLAIALALAAALCAALIYVLELLNNRFVNPDQIEKELGLAVLGILPNIDDEKLTEALADPKSGLSEAYRSLRTSIQFSGPDGMPKSLLVTSSEPSEGKSTTSYKLAQDFASLGHKVLIIDADMRKPSLHRLLGLDNTLGLSNLLTNGVRREDSSRLVRKSPLDNVWVITSGTIPPNPADLLSSTRMALLLDYMGGRFDIIIVDAPPVIGLSDAPILSRITQGVLLMVSTNNVSRKSAKAALKRLRSAGAHIIGASMSRFTVGAFDYNYAYKYMNYYYYQYGEKLQLEDAGGHGTTHAPPRFLDRLGRGFWASVSRFSERLKPMG